MSLDWGWPVRYSPTYYDTPTEKQMNTCDYEAAAKFLDTFHPGWFNKIDTKTLNMVYGDKCILGQLYGSYAKRPNDFRTLEATNRSIYNTFLSPASNMEWLTMIGIRKGQAMHTASMTVLSMKKSTDFGQVALGDELWYLDNNKVQNKKVTKITHEAYGGGTKTLYYVNNGMVGWSPELVFKSKADLINSL